MATAYLSVNPSGFGANFLRVEARNANDLSNVAGTYVHNPPVPASLDFIIANLEPVIHYIYFYKSVDGSANSVLTNTIIYDVKNQVPISEVVRYTADGMGAHDPASGQTDVVDPYLDGKTIDYVFKESFRELIPTIEYSLIAGGGVRLLGGATFSPGEVLTIRINYLIPQPPGSAGAAALKMKDAIDTITLDSSFDNSEISCFTTGGGVRQTITMRDIAGIQDRATFNFNTYDGDQINTVIKAKAGQYFRFNNSDVPYITLGKDEWVNIKKSGTRFKVLQGHPGLTQAGERFAGRMANHINVLPENDSFYNGLDYVRALDWIRNVLPATQKIVVADDTAVTTYVRTLAQKGCFIISSSGTFFRMPNMQGLTEKGLTEMVTSGGVGQNTDRLFGYPGGVQEEQVGAHYHELPTYSPPGDPKFNDGTPHPVLSWNVATSLTSKESTTDKNKGVLTDAYGNKNIVENAGFIYLTRI